jgi:hypothetical protein
MDFPLYTYYINTICIRVVCAIGEISLRVIVSFFPPTEKKNEKIILIKGSNIKCIQRGTFIQGMCMCVKCIKKKI